MPQEKINSLIRDNKPTSTSSDPGLVGFGETASISANPIPGGSGQQQDILKEEKFQIAELQTRIVSLQRKLSDQKRQIKKEVENLKLEIINIKDDDVKAVNDAIKRVRGELREDKEKITSTLAIFIGLFTFISVNFGFFANKQLSALQFLGLDLVLVSMLLGFIYLIKLFVHSPETKKHSLSSLDKGFLWVITLFFLGGIGIFFYIEWSENNNSFSDQKAIHSVQQPILEENIQPLLESSSSGVTR